MRTPDYRYSTTNHFTTHMALNNIPAIFNSMHAALANKGHRPRLFQCINYRFARRLENTGSAVVIKTALIPDGFDGGYDALFADPDLKYADAGDEPGFAKQDGATYTFKFGHTAAGYTVKTYSCAISNGTTDTPRTVQECDISFNDHLYHYTKAVGALGAKPFILQQTELLEGEERTEHTTGHHMAETRLAIHQLNATELDAAFSNLFLSIPAIESNKHILWANLLQRRGKLL